MQTNDIFSNLQTLENDRVILRKIKLDDTQDMFEYCSDPLVACYTSWDAHRTTDETKDFIQYMVSRYENNEVSSWGVEYKENNKLIGVCGFIQWIPEMGRAEIAYVLSRNYWNKGIMTDVVKDVIKFGFRNMQLNRIEAYCKPDNVASCRLLEKIGMSCEGTLRQYIYLKNAYQDLRVYSILKEEHI